MRNILQTIVSTFLIDFSTKQITDAFSPKSLQPLYVANLSHKIISLALIASFMLVENEFDAFKITKLMLIFGKLTGAGAPKQWSMHEIGDSPTEYGKPCFNSTPFSIFIA